MSKLFYSTSEVAGLFDMNRVTIYRWVKEGKIGAYRIGRHHKIPVSEVARLLEEFGFPKQAIRDLCGGEHEGRLIRAAKGLARD
jgi:excisionase family DNA binding protein